MLYFARLMLFMMLSLGLHLFLVQIEFTRQVEQMSAKQSRGIDMVARSRDDFLRQLVASQSSAQSSSVKESKMVVQSAMPIYTAAKQIEFASKIEEFVPQVLDQESSAAKPVADVLPAVHGDVIPEHRVELPDEVNKSTAESFVETAEEVVANRADSSSPSVAENEEPGESILLDQKQESKGTVVFKQAHPRYELNPPPVYPSTSNKRGQQGRVELKVLVSADGNVSELKIESSSGYRALDRAALKAVRFWQFRPAMDNGIPVDSWVIVPVDFVLD